MQSVLRSLPEVAPASALASLPQAGAVAAWSYEAAFARHQGIFTLAEQARLRGSRVAVAGLGGAGGSHVAALARLGIGSLHLADPDTFDIVNLSRQHGASMHTLGMNKARVLAEQARAINPDIQTQIFTEPVSRANIDAFLDGVTVLVDAVDFFAIESRRLIFSEAKKRNIWAVTACPLGFSTAWLIFDPAGPGFDEYFDINDSTSPLERLVAFAVGLAPAATHRNQIDLTKVDPVGNKGPALGLSCGLCSGVAASEVVKIILGRQPIYSVPWYCQFDAYRCLFRRGYYWGGNRHPWQRFKRWWLRRKAYSLGWDRLIG